MSDRLERLRALVDRALHAGTPVEEARTSAMQACRIVKELRLLDSPTRSSRRAASGQGERAGDASELDRPLMLKLGPARANGQRTTHILYTDITNMTLCGLTLPAAGTLEAQGLPGWGPRMAVRIPYWYEGRSGWERKIRDVCHEASGPWSYATLCQGCWGAWCRAQS